AKSYLTKSGAGRTSSTGNVNFAKLSDFNEDERHVVGGRAFTPGGDAVEDALLHLAERQERRFADEFLNAFDAEHFAARIEHVGDAVGVKHDAIAGVEVHIKRGFLRHCIWKRAQDHAARFEQAGLFTGLHDHHRRMAGAGEDHAPAAAVHASRGQREKENGAADVAHHEAVQLPHHVAERHAVLYLRHRLAVDAVGNQGRADAVAGDVADHQIQMLLVERTDQAEIAADGSDGMIERFHLNGAPDD